MRTTEIKMSDPALAQLAGMLNLTGRWFLPETAGGPDEFIRVRKEWEESGLAGLGFDGSLHPSPRFARMIYNLAHTDGALLCENEEEKTLFLKGPVDILMIARRAGEPEWGLALRPFHEAARWICGLEEGSCPVRLCFRGRPDREPECRVLDPEMMEETERRELLGSCLRAFCSGRQEETAAAVPEEGKEGKTDA